MADEKKKFSWQAFWIKLTSRAFWVWIINTAIVYYVLWRVLAEKNPPVYTWINLLLGIWGGSMVLFIGGNVLIDALSKSLEKAEIKLQTTINATANTSISGSVTGSATADSRKQQEEEKK